MGNLAVSVEHLGKRYRIGQAAQRPDNVRAAVRSFVTAPFAYLRSHLREPSPEELFWALKDVSFEVKHGEVLGIIGRNGAGKSTLLKILSRITEPTEGCAKVYGRVGSLLEVGTGFHPELTGRENIYLNGAILGMKRAEIDQKFDEIVEFSGVEKFLDTPVKRYSSGMYVRLAFAVAAHLEPEILIVDEVLAVGDVEFQKKCLGKMADVAKEGRTILFVSHNIAAILGLCPVSFYLNHGQITTKGETVAVVQQYLDTMNPMAPIAIEHRTDRCGNANVRLREILFFSNTSHIPLQTIVSGQDIWIHIAYVAGESAPSPLQKVVVGLSFFNAVGQFLMVLRSDRASRAFDTLPSEGTIYCHIPKFPLMHGDFSINAALYLNGELADAIENALIIHVQNGDFFGTGISSESVRQGVYVPHEWGKERG